MRRKYAQIRENIDKESRYNMSARILDILCESDIYLAAKTIFVYVSVGSEVKTHNFIDNALSCGKRVVVPLCDKKTHKMDMYEIEGWTQLEPGAYNIPEPKRDLIASGVIQKVIPTEIDLAIVPAVVFDKRGMRIGYGGGYYDRFLSEFKGVSVGVAYSQSVADILPTEDFDCGVDVIVCPEGMMKNGKFIYKG